MQSSSNAISFAADARSVAMVKSGSATRGIITIAILLFTTMLPVTLLVAPLKELVGDRYGASPFWVHTFMSINMIGAALAAPLIGVLSDAGRRRRVAAWALAADACLLSGMSLAPNLPTLLTLRFLEGASHVLALSTLMAIAGGWAHDNKRGRAMGIIGSAMMLGTAFGTRLGGEVWHHLPDWTFHVAGGISAAAALGVLFIVREAPEVRETRRPVRRLIGLLACRKDLAVPLIYSFIDRFCVGVVISTFVLFLADIHGFPPAERGKLLVLFLAPFAVLVYPAGLLVDRIGRVWPLAIGSAAFGVVFAAYGVVTPSQLTILMLLSGVLSALMFAPNLALCADLAPPDQRGAAFTGFNIAGSIGMLLGPLFGGGILAFASKAAQGIDAYRITFMLTGATEILCAVVTLPMLLALKRRGVTR
ncbi:MAG: MFS transporter [Planctomycetia bacterium]|jgi:MFS family permease|nr:MFS transporter [Planctomycetia bacterium]